MLVSVRFRRNKQSTNVERINSASSHIKVETGEQATVYEKSGLSFSRISLVRQPQMQALGCYNKV